VSQDELSSGLDRDPAGFSPWFWRIAALLAVGLKDDVAGPNLSGAPIVVRRQSGRTVLRSTLVDPGTVDPFGLYL
jgi:hypothetical protein